MSRTQTVHFGVPDSAEPGRGDLAVPEGDGPFPAVLVLHELLGLNDDMRRIASRLADEGYVALAPDYFGPGFVLGCIVRAAKAVKSGSGATFDRLDAARTWLAARPEVDSDRVGVVGFCMGGGFAVLHAARTDAAAVATFYGDVPKSAEALSGIPPCVAGYGGRDRVFGSLAERLEEHLRTLGVAHDVKTYPDAGHSYMSQNDGLINKISAVGPMHAGFDPDAATDSWSRMLDFFAEHV